MGLMVYHTELTTSKALLSKGGLEGIGLTVNHIKTTTTYTFYIKARSVIFSKNRIFMLHIIALTRYNSKQQKK